MTFRENEEGIYDVDETATQQTYQDKYPEEFEEDIEEPDESQTEADDYDEEQPEDSELGHEEDEQSVYRTQEDFDRAIKNRLARQDRKVARELGVSIAEAKEWIDAGRSIAEVSGLTPAQIKMKMEENRMQQANQSGNQNYNAYPQDDVKKELAEMKSLIEEDKIEKVRTKQEQEARKEFGDLYGKHQEDIEERAEELGLSLVDAAAIVLRPRLRDLAEDKARTKQTMKKSRKLEDSSGGPDTKTVDFKAALSPGQKRVAQRMGVSLEKYYGQLKSLGEIE